MYILVRPKCNKTRRADNKKSCLTITCDINIETLEFLLTFRKVNTSMKRCSAPVIALFLLSTLTFQLNAAQKPVLELTCKDFSWQDVVVLIEPYVDQSVHSAIVMQGISSNYDIALTASLALEENQPEVIKTVLKYLVEAKC